MVKGQKREINMTDKIKVYGSTKYIDKLSKRSRKGEYHKCESCGNEFYIGLSYIRKAHKLNINIRYCSMECYDKTGENNPFWGKTFSDESLERLTNNPNRPKFKVGLNNSNFVRFGEQYGFVGSSKFWWTRKLLNEIGECELCGYKDKRALCTHHIDRNPKNNERSNLFLICWNCHAIEHFNERTGMYFHLKTDRHGRGY